MLKRLHIFSYLLLSALCFLHQQAAAQTLNTYTSDNPILVTLEGKTQPYTFASNALLVNYNKTRQQLECILNLSSLVPLTPATPPGMAYDVFFGAKYPELNMNINVPQAKAFSSSQAQQPMLTVIQINMQGVTNETTVPVVFTPENQSALLFSTTFDLMLDDFQASIPIKYAPLLTGRIIITINSARWANLQAR